MLRLHTAMLKHGGLLKSKADLLRFWRRCATAKQSSSSHRAHPAEHKVVEDNFDATRHGRRVRSGSKPIYLSLPEQLEKLTSERRDKSPSLSRGFARENYPGGRGALFNRFLRPPACSSPASSVPVHRSHPRHKEAYLRKRFPLRSPALSLLKPLPSYPPFPPGSSVA